MLKDNQIKLIIGSLLHDIGKVVYRSGDGRNHSESGYAFLKEQAKIEDAEVLNCVRYHHGNLLRHASVSDDSLAYLTYYADNVASFTERRETENPEDGFDKNKPLESVFNILNGNREKKHYIRAVLNPDAGILSPTDEPVRMEESFYQEVVRNINDNLLGIEWNEAYINSLLSVLEANLSYLPSSTSRRELADISLYDHVKMTAAIASCIQQYLSENRRENYKEDLLVHAKETYEEEMFLLYSMDVSGIQKFIYTIAEAGALKGLRARSFYLELMMEHLVDELLEKCSLSRANLIYSGGGHCYILMPNTMCIRRILKEYETEVNTWLLDHFGIELYVAAGYDMASANNLRNVPKGSYRELYRTVSRIISEKKAHRYDAEMILKLNHARQQGERECKICRRLAKLTDDKCPICHGLERLSGGILNKAFFTIMKEPEQDALPLPGDCYLIPDTEKSLRKHMEKQTYVRSYTKNRFHTGKDIATNLWVGDYSTGETFEELANQAKGVKRIGILRADVDNLGSTFVYGFQRPDGDESYMTLSRTAVLSRQLSLFFKFYINQILRDGSETPFSKKGERKVVIVYSGGDDVFLAGAWNDVISAFMDLRKEFMKFTQETLSISGGIGLYHDSFPINVMAKEVELLEDQAKHVDGKDAVSLFHEEHTYPWKVFMEQVLEKKYQTIQSYFGSTQEHGMAFLYHLVELLRNSEEKINVARYVYLLSRMEPECKDGKEIRDRYRRFSKSMYEWSQEEQDRKELITAIYLYVYLHRETEGKE